VPTNRVTREYIDDSVAVTAVNTPVDFGFLATDVIAVNDGDKTVYLTLDSGVSTTGKFPVKAGETFTMRLKTPRRRMGLICGVAETSTVRVGAWR
jgi:hypothetical protein